MHERDVAEFRHPGDGRPLTLQADRREGDEIVEGALSAGGDSYRVVRGIPRFCPEENYADSFGYQWQHWSRTQLDSAGKWRGVSEQRLFRESQWPREMRGERVLEAGSGMGRFTEVLARTGARICTFDYSAAVDANRQNNGSNENVCFAQGDIYAPPYEEASFDRVICIGVLQHCPSPKRAFMSLTRFVRPGGHLFVDVYRLSWKSPLMGHYYLRPVTRKMSTKSLHRFVRFHVGWVFPLTGWLQRRVGRRGRSLSWMLGMADHRGVLVSPEDTETAREMSLLDTFDMLAPAYERPKTMGTVRSWFEQAGFTDIQIEPGDNGIAARGRRPECSDRPSVTTTSHM